MHERPDGTFDVLAGGGEMGALMRQVDWQKTSVGAVDSWPQSLRTAVSILLESKFAMLVAWGPEFTQFYNDAYRPILGTTKHPALGKMTPEVFPELWPTIGPLFEGVMQGQAVGFDDLMLALDRHRYLEECFFTFSYSPIRDERGGIGGVHVTVTETTARVLAERRLRILRDLAASASQAKDEVSAWKTAADILATNPTDFAFALLYRIGADGRTARRIDVNELPAALAPSEINIEGEARAAWPLAVVIASGKPELVPNVRDRSGDYAGPSWPEPVESALVLPITRPGLPRPYGVLVAGISPRRALDDSYSDFFVLASDQIATAIANTRTYEEEKRRAEALAELDRQKTAFFSNVSHEFRTPLTLMLGPTEDLLAGAQGELSSPQRAQLELLRRNELRLQRLVNALLDFSRIEAGRAQASYEAVDLATLTRDIASSFRSAIERAGMKLTVDCPALDEPAFVDRNMWEQIVLNLLSNAFKFTFEGEIEVSLRRADDQLELVVSDTGVGVRTEEVPRLFERFHRIEGTRARTHEGSGIGLALVQELVRLHGGSIQARSTYGTGTSFTVRIPRGSAHLPADRIDSARTRSPTGVGPALFVEEALRWLPEKVSPALPGAAASADEAAPAQLRRRVLVADDNADMRDYLRRILTEKWTVETVNDGAAALDAARARRPDLILVDVMMPVMDGFRLLRELRASTATATIPVIMLSARAGEESRVEGLQAGADDYLIKPFSARELVARVDTHLQLACLHEEIRAQQTHLFALFMQAPAPICVLRGEDLMYEMANQPYLHMIGRSEIVGKPLLEVFPELRHQGTDGRSFIDILRNVMTSGEAFEARELPATIERKGSAAPAYFDTVWAPVRSPGGHVDRVMVVATEVTDQVSARRRAEEAERELRDTVALRDEFLTVASHELRTPLTTLGFLAGGLLRSLEQAHGKGPVDERQVSKAEKLQAQADRLEQLIEGMLDVASVSRDKLRLVREEVDLAEVARTVVERLREESKQASATLDLRPEPSVGQWDRQRLEQILTQLLTNALKFGEGRPIDVGIGGSAASARVVVRDRGIGIAPEDHERIFGRFVRAAHGDHYAGFGLGLWITQELVKAMDGSIRVESQLGGGATFIVELPRHP